MVHPSLHKKFLLNILILTVGMLYGHAQQGSGLFNQAEILFKNKNYYEATQVYEKYLATERNSRPRSTPFSIEKKVKREANIDPHQEAVYHLAESYRLINNFQKAEKYYKESIKFSERAYPEARYWYAVTLRTNQNYAEAFVQITAFLDKHTQMDEVLLGADRELNNLKFIQQQTDRANDLFILKEMKGLAPASGYALAKRKEDRVVFTAILEEKAKNGQSVYTNTLYQSSSTENPLLGAEQMKFPTETGVNDGMASFSQDGQVMFFTRWTSKNGHTGSAIYMSRQAKKGWSLPVKADDPLNVEGSNSAQPFLTGDDRYVIFSSDRPGGSGGYDLWAASLDTNHAVIQVKNLGNVINTAGDEEAPFFHEKSRTLVFSTNGRVGMGGFDLFYARGTFNLRNWEKPLNAGAPLNSTKDDLYYIGTDDDNLWNTGWVSSDRSSECCLALFSVKGNNTQYVHGTIVDCQTRHPLLNVAVTVTDLRHPDRILGKYRVDTAGSYTFELHNSAHFKVSAALTGYEPASADFNLQSIQGKDSLVNDICMQGIIYPEKEIEKLLKSLERSSHVGNFAYKIAALSDSAHDNLDSLAKILKKFPDMVIQIEGYTDGIGGEKYNLILAQKRVDACIHYLQIRGIKLNQLQGKAMGKCCPIAPDTIDGKDNPAGREINRRVECKVLKH